ncbi:MAG TPA: MFS transporter [Streptosporangiaceae bacterium]|nr:MFS transporter [Streptosporangiaceae bacterium]
MSTVTTPPPATRDHASAGDHPRSRLLSRPLALSFVAEFTSLTSFFLLLSVMPMLAAAAGASSSEAGLITGSLLLGTVAAEAVAAPGIRRLGYRTLIVAGAVLLGAPALALLTPEPPAVLIMVSLVRGFGFGLCGVASGALTATLLPADRRGEGLGLLGLVSGVPAVVALPAGVWLAGHHLAPAVAVLAAGAGLLPVATVRWLPGRPAPQEAAAPARTRPRTRAALRLPLIFAVATIAAGVVDSFLPLAKGVPASLCSAALLVQAVVATLTRWRAGRFGDRHGHARLLVPALLVSALGLAAMIGLASPVLILASMVLFGAGFGVIEGATLALMLDQLPEATASARWNLAYDAGYGAGPAAFGLFAGSTGYPLAFALTGLVVLAAVPAALRERRAASRAASLAA